MTEAQVVRRVTAYIARHSRLSVAVGELARESGYSTSQLNRLFVRVTRTSPNRYLAAVRVEDAKRLLRTTPLSVLEVCHTVGYDSVGTFTRRFTDVVGVTPTQYRTMGVESYTTARPVVVPPLVRRGEDISGRVVTEGPLPAGLRVWVGLFPRPVPVGIPLAGAVVPVGDRFAIPLPRRTSWILAAAFPRPDGPPWVAELDAPVDAGEVTLRLEAWQPPQHPVTVALPPLARLIVGP